MKIADFFVQITAKGDLKELAALAQYQKVLTAQSKEAVAHSKVRVAELKKETAEIQKQKKIKKEDEPKTLKEILIARGKIFNQQAKMNGLMLKGVAQTVLFRNGIMGIVGSVVLATIAIDKMVLKLAQANQLYTNFQRQTGMSMRSAMGISSAMAGLDVTMSSEDIMQNMQNLQSSLVGIQFGMGNIAPYQIAGINPWGLNAANMIDVLRKQLKQFAPEYRTFLLQQMGLDPRLGALIDLSDKEYANMKAEQSLLYIDPQVRKDIQKIGIEMNKMFLTMKKMKDLLVYLAGKFISPLTTFLRLALNTVNIILEGIAKLPALLKTIEVIVIGIMTWITRGLIWLIPILEDLAIWASGGKSLFGAIFDDPEKAFGAIWEHLKDVLDDFLPKLANTITKSVKAAFSKDKDTSLANKIMTGRNIPSIIARHNPFLPMILTGSLLNGIRKDIYSKYGDRNVSMNNDININVGSVEDGQMMVDYLRLPLNSAISQMVGY